VRQAIGIIIAGISVAARTLLKRGEDFDTLFYDYLPDPHKTAEIK